MEAVIIGQVIKGISLPFRLNEDELKLITGEHGDTIIGLLKKQRKELDVNYIHESERRSIKTKPFNE